MHTVWHQRWLKFKMFFGFVGHVKDFLFQELFPLVMICIGFYLLIDTTETFFNIDMISSLGIYQFWTIPVVAQQSTTNGVLINEQSMYNSQLLPQLSGSMINNIEAIETTLSTFNQEQYFNVSQYNKHKCAYQYEIASYIDTYYCLAEYYDSSNSGETCNGCDHDMKAMCLPGGDFAGKEWKGDDIDVSKSSFAEKRKYCDFDKSTTEITWNNDDNITTIIPNFGSDSLTIKCPDGFIISAIEISGDGYVRAYSLPRPFGRYWHGIYGHQAYMAHIDDEDTALNWGEVNELCQEMDT